MDNVFRKIKRTFAVLSALFITVVTSKIRSPQNCGPEMVTQCSKPLSILTDTGLTFASSKADLERMCPDLRESLQCIHRYSRICMERKEQLHFRKLFHGTNAMVHDLCRNETYQEEYFKYAPCMQKVEKQNEMCLNDYKMAMNAIETKSETEDSTLPPDVINYQKKKRDAANENIKSVCCSFQKFIKCSTETVGETCGVDAAQFSRSFLDRMSSSLIKLHCTEYGTRECGLERYSSSSEGLKAGVLPLLLGIVAYYVR